MATRQRLLVTTALLLPDLALTPLTAQVDPVWQTDLVFLPGRHSLYAISAD